jgi:predicted transcriptional regulator
MFTVRLTEDLDARLNQAAKELGVSKSKFAREAIAKYMTNWEADLLPEGQTNDQNSPVQT